MSSFFLFLILPRLEIQGFGPVATSSYPSNFSSLEWRQKQRTSPPTNFFLASACCRLACMGIASAFTLARLEFLILFFNIHSFLLRRWTSSPSFHRLPLIRAGFLSFGHLFPSRPQRHYFFSLSSPTSRPTDQPSRPSRPGSYHLRLDSGAGGRRQARQHFIEQSIVSFYFLLFHFFFQAGLSRSLRLWPFGYLPTSHAFGSFNLSGRRGNEPKIRMSFRSVPLAVFFPAEPKTRDDPKPSGLQKGMRWFVVRCWDSKRGLLLSLWLTTEQKQALATATTLTAIVSPQMTQTKR